MAESVKRRVAAARLAVAFVAAGTIAGATAWAQASPPPPTAQSSAVDAFHKHLKITSDDVVDGSLLFKDFKKHEVASYREFKKAQLSEKRFEKIIIRDYATNDDLSNAIKGESADFVKYGDTHYMKIGAPVVNGDGSVFTASKESAVGVPAVQLIALPSQFTVDAQGPTITITNTSNSALNFTKCNASGAGTLQPTQHVDCDVSGGGALTVQLVGAGAGGGAQVSTLTLSGIPLTGGKTQDTVQILVGL